MKKKIYKSENIYEERSYMAGKQEGRREVVEWIRDNEEWIELEDVAGHTETYCGIVRDVWQAKLKEWRL